MKKTINQNLILPCILFLVFMSCGTEPEIEADNFMEVISIDPESPADLLFDERVFITYEYKIENVQGARMWVIPYTGGSATPRYSYTSSQVYNGEGTREVMFTIRAGGVPVTVDQLKVTMVTPDQSETLFETFIEVEFNFNEGES